MSITDRPTRARQITDAIGCEYLSLTKTGEHWLLAYSNAAMGEYETLVVNVPRLRHKTRTEWVGYGQKLIDMVQRKRADLVMLPGVRDAVQRDAAGGYLSRCVMVDLPKRTHRMVPVEFIDAAMEVARFLRNERITGHRGEDVQAILRFHRGVEKL